MKQGFARWLLHRLGWQVEGVRPEHPRCVLIAAPHTSNWDLPLMLAFAASFNIRITWMAKHSLFFPPLGWLLRAMGGTPIVRHENRNVVDAMAELLLNSSQLILVVPTEGTRERSEYWKSGFYHIACKAGVPIVPTYLNFASKRGGFGPALTPTGNMAEDMQFFRDFYRGMEGKFPGQFGPVRLREEDGST